MDERYRDATLGVRRMPLNLKGQVNKTTNRPDMLYGTETLATTEGLEVRIVVHDMMMVRWICGMTKNGEIRNERRA